MWQAAFQSQFVRRVHFFSPPLTTSLFMPRAQNSSAKGVFFLGHETLNYRPVMVLQPRPSFLSSLLSKILPQNKPIGFASPETWSEVAIFGQHRNACISYLVCVSAETSVDLSHTISEESSFKRNRVTHLLVRHSLHELIQQVVVLLPTHTLVFQPDVQRVSEQLLEQTASVCSTALV